MSGPVISDPAVAAIGVVIQALADAYSPTSSYPPTAGTNEVRFFAGEGPATAVWNPHTEGLEQFGCDHPFLWVRAARRYRTASLPEAYAGPNTCRYPRVIAVEVGVARCAVIELQPSWDDYENEAVISLEDSWRIEMALCTAAARLKDEDYLTATDEIVPVGPEGGIIAWSGTIFIQFAE